MEFKPERKGTVTPDFLSLVDRIMKLISETDQLLGNSLGYEISFHSMLASIEASSFLFQVDMEIEPPEQLILGDPMTPMGLPLWFSKSHETLISYLAGSIALEEALNNWKTIVEEYHCQESFLYREVEKASFQSLRKKYRELLEQEHSGLIFFMKKIA